MALPKRVKSNGTYYKGHQLVVSSSVGDYVLAIIPSATNHAVNSLSITPDAYGQGDNFKVSHVNTTGTIGGQEVSILAENVYNLGAGVTIGLDFASLELVQPGHSIRFIYTNTATVAMNVYVTLECIK